MRESEILTSYALRIAPPDQPERIKKATKQALMERRLPHDLETQAHCYHQLQRWLFKWGGEVLPETSADWWLFRSLFLCTALADLPQQLRASERYEEWERTFVPHRSSHLALVAAIHGDTHYEWATDDKADNRGLLDLYALEERLLNNVGHHFRGFGKLSAFDLFCMIIWKANRAKTRIARMLMKRCPGQSLDEIAEEIGASIHRPGEPRERMAVLFRYGFRLPMASAILTLLYPDDFTVFDVRACESLRFDPQLISQATSSSINRAWAAYEQYLVQVRASYPSISRLRDKDRALWAESFRRQLQRDIDVGFAKPQ